MGWKSPRREAVRMIEWAEDMIMRYTPIAPEGDECYAIAVKISDFKKEVGAYVCKREGHVVVNDQCGRPEHRYCLICDVPTPNMEETDGEWVEESSGLDR